MGPLRASLIGWRLSSPCFLSRIKYLFSVPKPEAPSAMSPTPFMEILGPRLFLPLFLQSGGGKSGRRGGRWTN